jgi:hypothetical protein
MTTVPISDEAFEQMEYIINAFKLNIARQLSDAGFKYPQENIPNVVYSTTKVKCYNPENGIHDFDAVRHYGYLEALGAYFPCDYNPEQRHFEIFTQNVAEVTAVYTLRKTSIPYNDPQFAQLYELHLTDITTLVLCHEIAHWMIHRCVDSQGKTIGKMRYSLNDEIFYHEGLAQSLLFEGLKEFDFMLNIMLWMESGQPQQYIAYKRLGLNCAHLMKAFHTVCKMGIQSFELLEQAIILQVGTKPVSTEQILINFLTKPQTPIFQKESIEDVYLFLLAMYPDLADKYRGVYHALKFNI